MSVGIDKDSKDRQVVDAGIPDQDVSSATSRYAETQTTWKERGIGIAARLGLPLTLVLFIAVFSAVIPEMFFTVGNFKAILSTQAALLFVALALTVPLATGDFDLSIGSMVSFGMALVTVLTIDQGLPWYAAILAVVGASLLVGAINGFLAVYMDVHAFVVTLGTGTLVMGCTLAITGGRTVIGTPPILAFLTRTEILGIPLVPIYAFLLAITLWYVFDHTPLGRYMYFVGGGPETARLAGISVRPIRFGSFVISATLCGIAGMLVAGQLGAADYTVGPSYLLPAYAAAFLGSTTIKQGRFNAWGTVVALLLIATGVTGLQLLGAPFWVEPMFNGVALTLAVTLARQASRRRGE